MEQRIVALLLVTELVIGRAQLMMGQQHRPSVTGVFNFIAQPFEFRRFQRGRWAAEAIVKAGIETDELPISVAQAEVAGGLLELIEKVIEGLAARVQIVVTRKHKGSNLAGCRLENVQPRAVEE